jgi:hypothetical protein
MVSANTDRGLAQGAVTLAVGRQTLQACVVGCPRTTEIFRSRFEDLYVECRRG